MSELKIGDRVKVAAFEGVVSHVSFYDPQNIEVALDGGGEASLPARRAEYVKPALKVGDVISDIADYRALPVGAVVSNAPLGSARLATTVLRTERGWADQGGHTYPSSAAFTMPRAIVHLPAA